MGKKIDHRDRSAVLWWDTEYDGSAIYALVDENGKAYIGRAKHLQNRLKTHRSNFRRILANKATAGEGIKLTEAVLRGEKFHAEILKDFPEVYEASQNTLAYWEEYYFKKYGGLEHTYNGTGAMPINTYYEPFNKEITWEEYEGMEKKPCKRRSVKRDLIHLCWYEEDRDIAEQLANVPDKQKYIKNLIRQDVISKRG